MVRQCRHILQDSQIQTKKNLHLYPNPMILLKHTIWKTINFSTDICVDLQSI